MKFYVCGPVTGFSDLNLPTFEYAAMQLQDAGLETVIPHEFVPPDASHDDAMCLCIERLRVGDIDAVAVLPGWEDSRGSQIELIAATALKIDFCPIDLVLEIAETLGRRTDGGIFANRFVSRVKKQVKPKEPKAPAWRFFRNNGYMKNGGE